MPLRPTAISKDVKAVAAHAPGVTADGRSSGSDRPPHRRAHALIAKVLNPRRSLPDLHPPPHVQTRVSLHRPATLLNRLEHPRPARLDQQAFAGLATQQRIESGRRAPDFYIFCRRCGFGEFFCNLAHRVSIIAGNNNRGEAAIGRRAGRLRKSLLRIKTVTVAVGQCLHHRIFGISGLQQHQPRLVGAAGAA